MLTRLYPWLKLLVMGLSALAIALIAERGEAAQADAAAPNLSAPAPAARTMTDDEAIARIEKYFNGMKTFKASFLQVAPDNSVSQGRVYIRRPGLLRVEYDPPVKFLIIGDGKWLNMIDYEVKSISRWSIDQTPLKILVKPDLNLRKDVDVRSIQEANGLLRLTVSSPDVPGHEKISFLFTERPFELRQWEVADGSGKVTRVALTKTQMNIDVPRDLFTYDDPREKRLGPRH